jgi:hypothetical protein
VIGFKDSSLSDDRSVTVADKDIEGVALQSRPIVVGQVVVEGGTPLPVNVPLPDDLDVGVNISLGFSPTCAALSNQPAAVRADGAFLWPAISPAPAVAECRARLNGLPLGYTVKSVTTAPPSAGNPAEFRVVLVRESAGFNVSGRLLDLPVTAPSGMPVVQISPSPYTGGPNVLAEVLPEADGTFVFRQIPAGTYRVSSPNRGVATAEVSNRDVAGLEIHSYLSPDAGTIDRILNAIPNRPVFQGKSLAAHIRERTGPDATDCGRFNARVRLMTEAALNCVREAIRARKPFVTVTAFPTLDTLEALGFLSDPSGTIYEFSSCQGMCGRLDFKACAPQSTLEWKRGELACEPPAAGPTIVRWPAPKP